MTHSFLKSTEVLVAILAIVLAIVIPYYLFKLLLKTFSSQDTFIARWEKSLTRKWYLQELEIKIKEEELKKIQSSR